MIFVRRTALLVSGAVVSSVLLAAPAQADFHDTRIIATTINNGRPIVMGASGSATVKVPITTVIQDDSGGVATIDGKLNDVGGFFFTFLDGPVGQNMSCVPTTSTTTTCTGTATVHQYDVSNSDAGEPVRLAISGYALDTGTYQLVSALSDAVPLLKQTTATAADAAPEPVRKGGTLTVTGRLTQPDWSYLDADGSTKLTVGYAKQPVKLQFKKAGATAYSTVKTVTSASTGNLRTTVSATTSGAWRWAFAGSSTSAASTSTGDDVTLLKVSKLTANAGPEPVRKGAKVTVTGRLTRATTDGATKFVGQARQSVRLQFRTVTGSYSTVKTVRTDADGDLRTTTTASRAGYWRWSYVGSSTTAPVSATGDHVALR